MLKEWAAFTPHSQLQADTRDQDLPGLEVDGTNLGEMICFVADCSTIMTLFPTPKIRCPSSPLVRLYVLRVVAIGPAMQSYLLQRRRPSLRAERLWSPDKLEDISQRRQRSRENLRK